MVLALSVGSGSKGAAGAAAVAEAGGGANWGGRGRAVGRVAGAAGRKEGGFIGRVGVAARRGERMQSGIRRRENRAAAVEDGAVIVPIGEVVGLAEDHDGRGT